MEFRIVLTNEGCQADSIKTSPLRRVRCWPLKPASILHFTTNRCILLVNTEDEFGLVRVQVEIRTYFLANVSTS